MHETVQITRRTEELKAKAIESFFASNMSSQSCELSSIASSDLIDSLPPRRNFLPVEAEHGAETPHHPAASSPRIEPLPTNAVTSTLSTSSSSPQPDSPSDARSTPDNPRAAFSSAFATVLTSTLVTGTRREVNTPLDCIEFWPHRPGPADNFTFGWEDMPGLRYPEVMRGKRFTIAFEDLRDRLEVFARTTDSTLVRENEEHVMGEWSDEGDSVETKESEESEEGEEEEVGDFFTKVKKEEWIYNYRRVFEGV